MVALADMARLVQVRVDGEIDSAITSFARENGLTRSQAVRELLRRGIGDMSPIDRGYKEGFFSGWANVHKQQR